MYFCQEPDLGGFYAKNVQNGSIQGQKAGERAPRIPKEPHAHHQTTSPKCTKPGLIHNNDYKKCSEACSEARAQTWRMETRKKVTGQGGPHRPVTWPVGGLPHLARHFPPFPSPFPFPWRVLM